MNKNNQKLKSLYLAVDFDGTLVTEAYPDIGKLLPDAKKYVNQLYDDGHYIIIWTCRDGEFTTKVEQFLFESGVKFHKINDNGPLKILGFGTNCRKVSADIYIDDKSVLGILPWSEMYKIITKKAKE